MFFVRDADYTYEQKYGLRVTVAVDVLPRETAMRGRAIAMRRKKFGIEIRGCLTQMGDIRWRLKTGVG